MLEMTEESTSASRFWPTTRVRTRDGRVTVNSIAIAPAPTTNDELSTFACRTTSTVASAFVKAPVILGEMRPGSRSRSASRSTRLRKASVAWRVLSMEA